jgi:hypothetical protein
MSLSRYSCIVLGEDPARVRRLHSSTIRRLRAWSISLHIPLALWIGTAFLVSREVFDASAANASGVAAACAGLIYCLERLILAAPKTKGLAALRVFIGLLTALLGACTVDLVVFDKEIKAQLYEEAAARNDIEQTQRLRQLREDLEIARTRWMEARNAAECEGNGTCGSGVRNAGPLYRDLLKHAVQLRADLDRNMARLEQVETKVEHERTALTPDSVKADAGLLNRLHALHSFVQRDNIALGFWLTFFFFVLALELSVVIAKFAFGETVDDVIDLCRESAIEYRANGYLEAVKSPLTAARQQLDQVYR